MISTQTPMLRQYQELKQQHPGTLLFFRLGDFYELFFDDAVIGSRELQITLTARHKERGDPVPMCGVPHHSAASYIARLVRKGYRVAICEQTEEASKLKKLVRREVVRVVTPGTPIDPQLLDAREAVFLAAVCSFGETIGAAFLDISTGEFRATQESGPSAWEKIRADLESYAPRELLFPVSLAPLIKAGLSGKPQTAPLPLGEAASAENQPTNSSPSSSSTTSPNTYPKSSPGDSQNSQFIDAAFTPLEDWLWQKKDCAELLLNHFGTRSLEGYGIERKDEAVRAAGACLRYAQETQRAAAAHVTDLIYFEPQDHLVLDNVTVRNLELVESLGGASGRTLLSVIDETVTGMGARLLRSWLLRPCVKRGEVEARLAAVQDLFASQITRDKLRSLLKEVSDLERLVGRISFGSASPRDLNAMSCARLAVMRNRLLPPSKPLNAGAAELTTCASSSTTSSATSLRFQRETQRACPPNMNEDKRSLTLNGLRPLSCVTGKRKCWAPKIESSKLKMHSSLTCAGKWRPRQNASRRRPARWLLSTH